jgi:glycosyltransferase involved in cell wall biosynthesis
LVADPDDPQDVIASVLRVLSCPDVIEAMGQRAREAAKEFDRRKELERFVGLVEDVARG